MIRKDVLLASLPIAFCKIIFGENHPATKIPHKLLRFSGIFIFQIFKYYQQGYQVGLKHCTWKPLPVRFQQNTSDPCVKWTESKRKSFNDTCLGQ